MTLRPHTVILTPVCPLKMLWAMVCQTFITALAALRSTSTSILSPHVSVPVGEIVAINSLNRVVGAMEAFKGSSPLIGTWQSSILYCQSDTRVAAAELNKLHTTVTNNQACILI